MGAVFNRQNPRIEETDSNTNNVYRYPPNKGNYFASHFIMAGERFETSEPESFLFGDNSDLNFLGGKPTPFPYPAPQTQMNLQTTLRSLINIRKESLRFIRAPESSDKERTNESSSLSTLYNIEFTFDTDVRCSISIYYFCTEEITANGVIYTPRDATMNSETYHYKRGVNQQFSQVSHVFDPSQFSEEMLMYKFEDEVIPVLIQCRAEEGEEPRQSHVIIAVVEKNADGTYTLKPLKQKLFVDGLTYLLQEIYGIENKSNFVCQSKDEDHDDTGSECVICMSDARNTLILPCRHLCLCNNCADSLRYQASNCPICRSPFRALLQIRAVRKANSTLPQISHSTESASQEIPSGYEQVSLIEALNGPLQPSGSLVPSFVPGAIPPFGNSPDIRKKHLQRHLDRHHSSSASLRMSDNINSEKDDPSLGKLQRSLDGVPSILSSEKALLKGECLSLTRGEGRRHKKGFRTSSAPEKIRLLANSVQIVNEVGGNKRKMEKDAELAETRSLLESNVMDENTGGNLSSPKSGRPCSSSPISLSTPHSLHLCEKLCKDASSGGEDSDYYTPEDPSTTILVDQGTDTSLDTPHGLEPSVAADLLGKVKGDYLAAGKHKFGREKQRAVEMVETDSGCRHEMQKRNSDPLIPAEDISP